MITSAQCLTKYGKPELEKAMVLWDIPTFLELGVIPKKIYCNRDLILPLTQALTNVIERDLITQVRTWDGCFNIRKKRGGSTYSLHSWGIAIDLNSSHNSFGKTYEQLVAAGRKPFSEEFLQCFRDAGFTCGSDFSGRYVDRMHFELSKI